MQYNSFMVSALPQVFRLTQFDFHHSLEQTQGLAVVYFTAQACGACRHLLPVLTQLPGHGIQVYQVDAEQELALVKEFEVFHLPAMFLYVDGCFHAPLHSEPRLDKILQTVSMLASAPPQEAP